MKHPKNWLIVTIIPVILILTSIAINKAAGPFYLTRIDPEYVYLLNGLNCSILEFDHIGHVDHPGTPFQIVTGIFILLTYIFAGQGGIAHDVISRPELYLSGASFLLSLLTALSVLWLGKINLNITGKKLPSLILQCLFFFSFILIETLSRYMPDRFLIVVIVLLIGFIIKFLYQPGYSEKKFAFISGVIMGIGLVTKFHFFPLLIVPLFLIKKFKNILWYVSSLSLSAILNFMPVHNHHAHFRKFITRIVTHEGLYGTGTEQIFNWHGILDNIKGILYSELSFTLAIILAAFLVIYLNLKSELRDKNRKEIRFLWAFLCISLIGILVVAKHYKNFYIIPIVSFTAFAYYTIFRIGNNLLRFKYLNFVFIIFLLLLFIKTNRNISPYLRNLKSQYSENMLLLREINNHISKNDYLLTEPTWRSGPAIENALVFGLSYIKNNSFYYKYFHNQYPNLLTWEGEKNPLKFARMFPCDMELLFKSGKNIYVLSTDDRNADVICTNLKNQSDSFHTEIKRDTVFSNAGKNEYLIRLSPDHRWGVKAEISCGFEKFINGQLYTDDEKFRLVGNPNPDHKVRFNGNTSLLLESWTLSPYYHIDNLKKGDIIEATILCTGSKSSGQPAGKLVFSTINDSIVAEVHEPIVEVGEHWYFYRLKYKTDLSINEDTIKCYFQNAGSNPLYCDDFEVKHLSENY